MSDWNKNPQQPAYGVEARGRADAFAIDEGLRAYMLRIYNYMGIGLVVTGVVAYLVYSMAVTTDPALAAKLANGAPAALKGGKFLTALGVTLWTGPIKYVIMFAPLVFVFIFAARINSMGTSTALGLFFAFAALMGASISSIFAVFSSSSIAQIFFITAAAFGALSLWGYTTKKDLSGWGSFLIMGVIGIVIAAIVNIFLKSSALQFAISSIAVLVFAGLTAYDTQRLKDEYYTYLHEGEASLGRSAIMGALSLYLNFLNMFMAMLSLFGNKE